jgi:DNA (cytosine-5)-methyltransferase 1
VAGKRRGFEDTRGTLFFEIARIAKQKQPRLLLLENVKGLLSHDSGNTFKTILRSLDELGYDCQWQVLNSKDFGVPQNRERVFIIGHLRGTSRPEVFPIRGSNSNHLEEITKGVSDAQRIYSTKQAKSLKGLGGGLGAKTGLYKIDNLKIRRLTPVECERLQGFPDNWTKYGHDDKEMSDTQRYKQLGNAVSTPVVTAIVERLL